MKRNRAGYTIVEIMIVTAISGVIAVSAFGLLNGQQQKIEFTNAVRDFEMELVDVSNDIGRGYFPRSDSNPGCHALVNGNLDYDSGNPPVEQGQNPDCIFIGKAIRFTEDNRQLTVMTLAARRVTRTGVDGGGGTCPLVKGGKAFTDICQLQNNDLGSVSELDEQDYLLHGLRIKSIEAPDSGVPNIAAIVFVSGFSQSTASAQGASGAPSTRLYVLRGPPSPNPPLHVIRNHLSNPVHYAVPGPAGVVICVEQGTGGQTALIELGKDGRQGSATVRIEPC